MSTHFTIFYHITSLMKPIFYWDKPKLSPHKQMQNISPHLHIHACKFALQSRARARVSRSLWKSRSISVRDISLSYSFCRSLLSGKNTCIHAHNPSRQQEAAEAGNAGANADGEQESSVQAQLETEDSMREQEEELSSSVSESVQLERRLKINLDLELYRAKSLARKGRFADAYQILRQCIRDWPDDGRPYMTLGRLLSKQAKYEEARSVFESGCQATQGENAHIWQGWAILERKMGNITKARKLFDAAIVANKKHVAAWHGWACLEIDEGNVKKATDLLQKGLRFCGPNEYIFQTLALLEVKARRYDAARSLFLQATKCNLKSCASWLAWAQLEAEEEDNNFARYLFERAVQASPRNRFAWHIWALFEANQEEYDKARKLFRVGHALNPRDPVILQSLALFEYKCSSAIIAREIFKQASQVDPRHQAVWIAWGWMEWKEGNIGIARELYKCALAIDSNSTDAARCLQAWGVLEEREGNIATARRLFKSSLNIDSQSFVTWMSWASLEENHGNSVRAEEIRNLYFQQRTEIVGDSSWDVNLSDLFAPAIKHIKGFLKFDFDRSSTEANENEEPPKRGSYQKIEGDVAYIPGISDKTRFDMDSFLREKLSLDVSSVYKGVGPFFLKKKNKSNFNRMIWKKETVS